MARVLLVDDDERILKTLELALKSSEHDVLTASGPEEALQVLAQQRPDVLVVDVMMPSGTEGFHLVWKIRQLEDEGLRTVPIIMATGVHEETELRFYPEESDGTYEPGEFLPVQGWIDKPIDIDALRKKIREVLDA